MGIEGRSVKLILQFMASCNHVHLIKYTVFWFFFFFILYLRPLLWSSYFINHDSWSLTFINFSIVTTLLTSSSKSKFIEETVGEISKILRGLPDCTSRHYLADVSKGKETSATNPKKKAKHGARSPLVCDSPLASSKIYGQLTPPVRNSCRIIQITIF